MSSVQLAGIDAEEARVAMARSSLFAWLATNLAFPTPELCRLVESGGLREEFNALAISLPYPLSGDDGLGTDGALGPADLETEYIRIFEVGAGQPPCPLYEGSHRSGRQQVMEDLVRFYEHFGLRHSEGDLPDHLCAELEFMHYLAFKETASLQAGTDREPYRLAQRDFLDRHLNRWLPQLSERLRELEVTATYVALVRVAEEACRRDQAFLEGSRSVTR